MVKWAGWLITLCGLGHTVGALVETAPRHAGRWLRWELWQNADPAAMTDTAAAFWYTAYSFGPPLLLVGLIVLWLAHRDITPPQFVAWAIAAWTVLGAVLSGLSPLLLLLVAAALLLTANARRTAPSRPI